MVARERTIAMEVERVMNLVRGFGWEKTKEEVLEDKVVIQIEKSSPVAEEAGAHITPT